MIISVDVGTTKTKAHLVGEAGDVKCSFATDTGQVSSSRPGWREHDPDGEWWGAFRKAVQSVLLGAAKTDSINVLCVSGMWPTLVLVDRNGRALQRAFLYNDRRAESIARRIDPSLSRFPYGFEWVPNIVWMQENRPEEWTRCKKIHTTHSYLVRRLTGEDTLDHHTAQSLGGLYRIDNGAWDAEELSRFGIGEDLMPKIAAPVEVVGNVSRQALRDLGLRGRVKVVAGVGDTFVSMLSAGLSRSKEVMLYLGSVGHLIGLRTGFRKAILELSLVCDEENIRWFDLFAEAGKKLQWAATLLSNKEGPDWEAFELAVGSVPIGANGVRYNSGSFTERKEQELFRGEGGSLLGLSPRTTRAEIARAVVEELAMRIRRAAAVTEAEFGDFRLHLGGGGIQSRSVLQTIADSCRRPLLVCQEAGGAYGGGLIAAAGLGLFDVEALQERRAASASVLSPVPSVSRVYDALYESYASIWRDACRGTRS